MKRTFVEGDPAALLCVEFYAERGEELLPRLDALERDLARADSDIGAIVRSTSRRMLELDPLKPPSVSPWREGRCQSDVLRRRHRRRSERLRDYIDEFLQMILATAHTPASMPMRRSDVCTCGPSST